MSARVLIVADDALQRHRLQQTLETFGLRVVFSASPARYLDSSPVPGAELTLVEIQEEARHPELLEKVLSDDHPVLFNPGSVPEDGTTQRIRWERRLLRKLEAELGPLEPLDSPAAVAQLASTQPRTAAAPRRTGTAPPASCVWVLGASLGGPAALRAFIQHLPSGLPVAFVCVQHIDPVGEAALTQALSVRPDYPVRSPEPGQPLRCGDILQVPVGQRMALDAQRRLQIREAPWPGPYAPSVDQVMLDLAEHYGNACHAIIFSGMGNDGALAAPQLKAGGSQIWCQSQDSCVCHSMPESVAAVSPVDRSAEPATLARDLGAWINAQRGPANAHARA